MGSGLMKALLFIILFNLIPLFFFNGCGEDSELSDMIIGSWCREDSYSSRIHYDGINCSGVISLINGKSTLTLSKVRHFNLVAEYDITHESMTKDGYYSFTHSNVRFIIAGSYDILDHSISFHCDKSYSDIIIEPPQESLRDMLISELNGLENLYSGTLDASVNSSILWLDDTIWLRA